jgi:hypothetical protein
MAQKDSKINIELAETTTVIARESKKDSSAMKAIALLTMCFLPGTFLAVRFHFKSFIMACPIFFTGGRLTQILVIVRDAGVQLGWR